MVYATFYTLKIKAGEGTSSSSWSSPSSTPALPHIYLLETPTVKGEKEMGPAIIAARDFKQSCNMPYGL